ncbi:hypothetical protein [Blastomonas sp.]|uniref:hypothetical protein n=1 Tax=Blastomonas sp. TaxID=1909299 RepID=UPI00406A285D
MADRPFISRELDRRIASAEAAIAAGRIDPETAEANIAPWAAAEAWLAGHPVPGTSPRNGDTRAADICPIDRTLETVTRARDAVETEIQRKGREDLLEHWRELSKVVRQLERQRAGMAAWQAMAAGQTAKPPIGKPALLPMAPSKLADMFDANGDPIPLPSQQAA